MFFEVKKIRDFLKLPKIINNIDINRVQVTY